MRLLVFGKTGQIAKELSRHCPSDIAVRHLDRAEADLSDPGMCRDAVLAADADAVINLAAYTLVDQAEVDEKAATIINAEAPGVVAEACAEVGIPLLHMSTDYVFDGSGSNPFAPNHMTSPLSAYGRSKLAGEEAIRASGARHLILRTSWVFSAHGQNFLTTMQALGKSHDVINVVADQIGGPTPAQDIAKALFVAARAMVDGHKGGTHHFAGLPDTSWADFARVIMKEADLTYEVRDIASSEYQGTVIRPLNSRLDCTSFTQAFGVNRPDWRFALNEIIAEQK